MKRLLTTLMILIFILAFGCAKEAPAPEASAEEPAPAELPEMGQIEDVNDEVVLPPAEEIIEERMEPETPAPAEEEPEASSYEIMLNPNKTMSKEAMTIKKGTTLSWINKDTWPHILAVESGKSFDTIRHAESSRIEGEQDAMWEYTFNETGTFLVRDIFSGRMRMTVTVE